MQTNRPNVILAAVTVLSLLFGIYGFLFGGVANAPAAAPQGSDAAVLDDPQKQPAANRARGNTREARETERASNQAEQPDRESDTDPIIEEDPTPGESPPPVWRGDGVIEGTVVDPQGVPLAGKTVRASPHSIAEEHMVYGRRDSPTPEELKRQLDKLKRETLEAQTGAEGKFRIEGVSHAEGYQVTVADERWGEIRRRSVMSGQVLYLQFIDVPITQGTVRDEAGKPVESPLVAWSWGDGSWGGGEPQPDGRFTARWEGERAGFRIESLGYMPTGIMDESYKGRTDVQVVLKRAPQLEVQLVTSAGAAIPLAHVSITSARGADGAALSLDSLHDAEDRQTDMRGLALFRSLPPGTYELTCAAGAGLTPVVSTVELQGDLRWKVTLDPGRTLTVRLVTAEGKPIAEPDLSVLDAAGEYMTATELETGEPGEIRLLGLPATPVQLQARASGYPSHWLDVDLTAGSQSLEVVMQKGGRVKGKVVDGTGSGLESVLLRWTPEGGAEKGRGQNTYTESDGTYQTDYLLPGNWTVELYRDWRGERLLIETITVTSGESTRDFTLGGVCVLKVIVEYEQDVTPGTEWTRLWVASDDETEPAQEWLRAGDKNEKRITLKEGRYLVSANTETLACQAREVTVTPGETVLRLSMGKANALRFIWVEAGSEIAKAGIKTGDVLVEYNGQAVTSKAELNRLANEAGSLDEVDAVILRGSTRHEVKMPKLAFHYWLEAARR